MKKDKKLTTKLAYISAIAVIIAAIVTGIFSIYGSKTIEQDTKGDCAPAISGVQGNVVIKGCDEK